MYVCLTLSRVPLSSCALCPPMSFSVLHRALSQHHCLWSLFVFHQSCPFIQSTHYLTPFTIHHPSPLPVTQSLSTALTERAVKLNPY
ncbi:uncharacterized protein B0T23DRAFT_368607 [Neurospora hispaniola]|uniref:Uncharacterized protein n=1 Tax=Neurospora hispaniola TaxID=588809 RepID=A0AAJ0IFC2_9PEZI|nr:hypothetical protein B0T23DRAFT_368607 [Neurospora hispaniola]